MSDAPQTRDPHEPPSPSPPESEWWMQPQRCRDRVVRDISGARLGHVDLIVRSPDGGAQVFCIVVLGSVSRLGNEGRAIPADLLAESEGDDTFLLLCDPAVVRTAPIHVEGSRCACSDWYARVRRHYEAFAGGSSPSGKTPHSSSP